MKIKERRLKGHIGILYLLLSIGFFMSGIKSRDDMLSYIGFSCLGLSIRAFVFVYKKWNTTTPLTDKVARICLINYLFYYPLLVLVIFILAFNLNYKYSIASLDFLAVSILSFYVGFDIVRAAGRFNQ